MTLGSEGQTSDAQPRVVRAAPPSGTLGRYDYMCGGTDRETTSLEPAPQVARNVESAPQDRHDDIFDHILRFVAADVSDIDLTALTSANPTRSDIADQVANRRTGALDLDQLYARAQRATDGSLAFDGPRGPLDEAFLRLHNLCVDHAPPGGSEARFEFARTQARWLHQWLVMNDLLPQLCDAEVLEDTLTQGAPLYAGFLRDQAGRGYGGKLPVPIEATVFFGASLLQHLPPSEAHQVTYLFDVTGDARFAQDTRLATNIWASDTGPLFNMDGSFDARAAHRVTLNDDPNRDLLCLPDAASCLAVVAKLGIRLPKVLDVDPHQDLASYVQAEAEIWSDGQSFGPLGSRLLAETLAGLVLNTPGSHVTSAGVIGNHWHPRDGVRPNDTTIDSYETLARVTGLI